jgi:hypothetical protein
MMAILSVLLSFQAGLLPLSTYPVGSPERALLTEIHYWKARNWKGIIALQRPEWHKIYPGGTGPDDPDDPMWAVTVLYGRSSPISVERFSREQLSAGIVRLTTVITEVGNGKAPGIIKKGEVKRYQLRCKVYPRQGGGWANDMNHCSQTPLK